MAMAIALLPHENTREGFRELEIFFRSNICNVVEPDESLKFFQFLHYFDKTWLTGNLII